MKPRMPVSPARTLLPALSMTLIACSAPERNSGSIEPERSATRMMTGSMPMMSMHPGMMQGGMMGGGMQDMRSIRGLLASHESIERKVINLPNGVRTITTSQDPQVVGLIRTHVREMKDRYERDQPIRRMDPLFRELFEHRNEASLQITDIPGGVEVLHTSSNPEVVRLIRQHARHFVNGVVEQGMAGAMGPTPLPQSYTSK